MKRYYSSYKVNHSDGFGITSMQGDMVEKVDGDWVKYEDVKQIEELNREMENALIEIKEYWGGSPEGALDAIQHVNEIANWILAKAKEAQM